MTEGRRILPYGYSSNAGPQPKWPEWPHVRTASGREIDPTPVPVPSESGPLLTVPIERKWSDHGWRSEAKVIEGKHPKGIVATKSVLDLGHLPGPYRRQWSPFC